MNELTVRSKIYVWAVALCVVCLLGASIATSSFAANNSHTNQIDPSAIAGGHAGSTGGGG